MHLMVMMCKYIFVLYVDINKFAIVVVHNGPLKKKKKKICKSKTADKLLCIRWIQLKFTSGKTPIKACA